MIFQRTSFFTFLSCAFFVLFVSGVSSLAYAEQKGTTKKHRASPGMLSGKVTDIINVPNYTYIEVSIGKNKVWVAGPVTPFKKNDRVSFSAGMPMENFHSKSMKRDFSIIYFVSRFITANKSTSKKSTNKPSPHTSTKNKKAAKPVKGIKKIEGGYTLSEIYSDKEKLKGKVFRVRGKVTKFTANILGKNWIHIRDSSTLEDLTITTKDIVSIDDVVIIEGTLELNKDFGYGYLYPVILVNAKVVKL